jgi:hypothetical protein
MGGLGERNYSIAKMIQPPPLSWKSSSPSVRAAQQPKCGKDENLFIALNARKLRDSDARLHTMISRPSETERTMFRQRLDLTEERIAEQEAGIQRLKEKGQPTVEAERLLRLMLRSHVLIRRHFDLIARDQEKQDGPA